MIELTKLSGDIFWVNPHQIEYIEKTPDTSLVMLSGKRLNVRESVEQVLERNIEYRKKLDVVRNEE